MNLKSSFSKYSDFAIFLIRLVFGIRLIWGTQDNVFSFERMEEFAHFLEANGFPFPMISAFTSVYLQFFAGICWILGVWVRESAAVMAINFIVALLMVHIGDSYINAAPAIHLLAVSILLLTCGAGKWSVRSLL